MTILYSEIAKSIYAKTALASLFPENQLAILHPDHEEALTVVIRDCLAVILAHLPADAIESVEFSDGCAEISFAYANENIQIQNIIIQIVSSLAIDQIRCAANGSMAEVSRLSASLTTRIAPISNILEPPVRPARITRWPR